MSIALRNLTKRLGNQLIVDDLSLQIRGGEFFVLLGASGSGKSTILRMIAGLSVPDSGHISLGINDVTEWPPQSRRVGFVFQNYSLFQNLNVSQNIEFGMKIRKMPAPKRDPEESWNYWTWSGSQDMEAAMRGNFQGGQQQRVALARALAYQPKVLLLDEPFGALDSKTRIQLRRSLKSIQQRLRITTILVTHDQEEAFELADRIGVIEHGKLLEVGEPEELYHQPKTLFGATFLGTGTVLRGKSKAGVACFGPIRLSIPPSVPHDEGADVQLLIRPEDILLTDERPENENIVLGQAEIRESSFAASSRRVRFSVPRLPETLQISPLVPEGEFGLIFDTVLPLTASLTKQNPWVSLRSWHILQSPSPRLLVCDDGHGPLCALRMTNELAKRLDASVTVLGVSEDSEASEELVSNLKKRCEKAGLPSPDVRLRFGNPAQQIACEQMESLYEMIIFLVKPRLLRGFDPRPKRIGSTIRKVLDNAVVPVLLVSGKLSSMDRAVILTYNRKHDSNEILVGRRFAQRFGLPITLVHVSIDTDNQPKVETEHLSPQDFFPIRKMGAVSNVRVCRTANTVEGILSEIQANRHELIIFPRESSLVVKSSSRENLVAQLLSRTDKPLFITP